MAYDYNLDILNNMSEEEKQLTLKILNELSKEGKSKVYDDLLYEDYEEIPVDIETFVDNDNYLGLAWKDGEGKSKLYPYWRKKLRELFPDNITTSVNNLIESGARGLGKSEIAILIAAYLMHRIMCLKNPLEHFHLKPTEKICFAFMNIKLDLAEEIGNSKFQNTIKLSPWFMDKGSMQGRSIKMWVPPEPISIIIGSQASDVIGLPIYFAFFDEISFIKNQDIDKQKQKAIDMIDTAIGGQKTRFLFNGKIEGLITLASSKRSEKSFLEQHMKKKLETEKENVLIVDEAVWNIKPPETYSGVRFNVALGNKFLPSLVIENDNDIPSFKEKGYNILSVPIEFKSNFLEDMDRALCDYAGISSSEISKYISGQAVNDIINTQLINPFTKDIIEVGNAPDDTLQYYDFFDLNKINTNLKRKPLFIHLDMSVSGDMTGIAGVWIKGKKTSTEENQSKDLFYTLAFSVSIKAPKGRQISFEKNRNFIYWLKEQGFNIKGISSDTFQSYDTGQALLAKKYPYEVISVDRCDPADHICKPYQHFKSTIYEKRLEIYKSETLIEEIINLERNINTGKVDHPPECFTEDTKIKLVDGRSLTILELIEEFNKNKINYVYSINLNTKKIEPKPIINAWKTGENKKLIKITLDNNESIRCTYNHPFMLRNGSYIEAQKLIPGDSLMPLYTKYPNIKDMKNYRLYYEPFEDKWHYEHRQFAKKIIDEKYLVHHIDCNPNNNNPNNLIWCSKQYHQKIHNQIATGCHSKESKIKKSIKMIKYHQNKDENYLNRNEKIRQKMISKDNVIKYREKIERYANSINNRFNIDYNNLNENDKKHYAKLFYYEQHPEIINILNKKRSKAYKEGKFKKSKETLKKITDNNKKLKLLFPDLNKEEFKNLFGFEYDSINPPQAKGVWTNRYRQKLYNLKNHKVVSIEYLDEKEDVYDIEVKDNHNFALDCGVFVHNCHKDVSDAVCGSLFNASKHAEEFAFDYGEDIETITKVSGSSEVLGQEQLQVEFEKELQSMFTPKTLVNNQKTQDQNNNAKFIDDKKEEPKKRPYMDFGMGPAQTYAPQYLNQGIILF